MTTHSLEQYQVQGSFTWLADRIVHSGHAGSAILVIVVTIIAFSTWLVIRPQH